MKSRAKGAAPAMDKKKALVYAVGLCGLATFRVGVREIFPDPVESSMIFWSVLLGLFVFERWVLRMRKKWS